MAIVSLRKTKRSLCGTTLSDSDIIVGFPHFIWDETTPPAVYGFSNASEMLVGWDQREAFRGIHNSVWPEIMPNHPREMQYDGSITEVGADCNERPLKDVP